LGTNDVPVTTKRSRGFLVSKENVVAGGDPGVRGRPLKTIKGGKGKGKKNSLALGGQKNT